jgi:dolichol-phosphate mannosyltransferase
MIQREQMLSMVVPVRNEQEVLEDTYATLTATLEELEMPFEVVVVDNGSHDRTPEIMSKICAADARWRYLRLSRNFEYQNSITAGMLAASGDAIMCIDSDLQDPPELIATFVAKWREGYDIVYGVRETRTGESRLRITATMWAMRFITWMSDEVKLPAHSADFRLISRRARDAFARLPEANRYVRGMIHWLGFRQLGIPYVRRGRAKGVTNNTPLFLVGFALNAVFSSSLKPLRAFSIFGAGVLLLTVLLGATYVLRRLFMSPPEGFTTVSLLQLANLGTTALGIGILGEYIARIYTESKRRPLWLVDYTLNFAEPPHTPSTDLPVGSPHFVQHLAPGNSEPWSAAFDTADSHEGAGSPGPPRRARARTTAVDHT